LLVAVLALESIAAEDDGLKHGGKALAYSLVPTLAMPVIGAGLLAYNGKHDDVAGWAGFWIAATGLILGPSGGHIYAERRHPFSGSAIRLGFGTIAGVGLIAGVADALDDGDHSNTASSVMLAGTIGLVASAVYDIVTAGRRPLQSAHDGHQLEAGTYNESQIPDDRC